MRRIPLFFILIPLLWGCESREIRLQQFLLKGNQHLADGEWAMAEYYYKQAIELDSAFSDALNNLGTTYFRKGRWDEAIFWYDKAIAAKARPAWYLNRANAWYENKAYFNAAADVDQVLAVRPDTVPAMVLRGLILARQRQYPEAIDWFSRAIEKDTLNPEHLVNRGTLSYYMRHYEVSMKDLNHALTLAPDNAEALNALAMVHSETGDQVSAFRLITKALEVSPRHPHYLNNRGYIYLRSGKLDLADADITASMVIDPDNPWVYRNRGIEYLEKGDPVSAERMFRQVLASDSTVERAAWYLVESVIRQGRTSDACRLIRRVPAEDEIPSNWRHLCR